MPRLAYSGEDDPALGREQPLDRRHKGLAQRGGQSIKRARFCLQDTLSRRDDVRSGQNALGPGQDIDNMIMPAAARIARGKNIRSDMAGLYHGALRLPASSPMPSVIHGAGATCDNLSCNFS